MTGRRERLEEPGPRGRKVVQVVHLDVGEALQAGGELPGEAIRGRPEQISAIRQLLLAQPLLVRTPEAKQVLEAGARGRPERGDRLLEIFRRRVLKLQLLKQLPRRSGEDRLARVVPEGAWTERANRRRDEQPRAQQRDRRSPQPLRRLAGLDQPGDRDEATRVDERCRLRGVEQRLLDSVSVWEDSQRQHAQGETLCAGADSPDGFRGRSGRSVPSEQP